MEMASVFTKMVLFMRGTIKTVKEMDRANFLNQTKALMRDNGLMISSMDWELKITFLKQYMLVIMKKD